MNQKWRSSLCASSLLFALVAGGCAGGPIEGSPQALQQSSAMARNYHLATGDKLHVDVFGESNLSGDYTVTPSGSIDLPLAGQVKAAGLTIPQLQNSIVSTLRHGYVEEPKVTVSALQLRPYYILGQVNKPGQYPYTPNLTVLEAVATAEGFTYRADKSSIFIRHPSEASEQEYSLTSTTAVEPGDTIRVTQRYF